MNIAYVVAPGRGETNLMLAEAAQRLADAGLRLVGTVQIDTRRATEHDCDMDVRVLPEGPVIRISQSLGQGATGCRLDPAQLEQAVALTQERLAEGSADLMMVNKFGKHETLGRGFREPIGAALAGGVPVLVGVNAQTVAAFQDFCGGAAVELPAQPAAILDWALGQARSRAA